MDDWHIEERKNAVRPDDRARAAVASAVAWIAGEFGLDSSVPNACIHTSISEIAARLMQVYWRGFNDGMAARAARSAESDSDDL